LAIGFLHESKDEEKPTDDPNAMLHLPPSVSFVTGAYTENGRWFAGGGHAASWSKDTIRYTGVAGYGDFNLKFYGVESEVNPEDVRLEFNIKGAFLLQELIFRIRESNFFIGGRYSYLGSDIEFKLSDDEPYIDMRGIPALRYQGEEVVLGEVEARWDVTPRWSLVGFVGTGRTADSFSDLSGADAIVAGGGGFRYLMARHYGLRVGLDVARGSEDTVVYLAVGSNWN